MSTYKTSRNKTVHFGSISLYGGPDGGLRIRIATPGPVTGLPADGQGLNLTEGEASALYDLLGDVMAWDSSASTTESELDRTTDRADADERLNDPRAMEAKR